jgi:hypothetical protein
VHSGRRSLCMVPDRPHSCTAQHSTTPARFALLTAYLRRVPCRYHSACRLELQQEETQPLRCMCCHSQQAQGLVVCRHQLCTPHGAEASSPASSHSLQGNPSAYCTLYEENLCSLGHLLRLGPKFDESSTCTTAPHSMCIRRYRTPPLCCDQQHMRITSRAASLPQIWGTSAWPWAELRSYSLACAEQF